MFVKAQSPVYVLVYVRTRKNGLRIEGGRGAENDKKALFPSRHCAPFLLEQRNLIN